MRPKPGSDGCEVELVTGTRTVAVIQARCGSERLPNKAMRDLAGRPLTEHVLRAVMHAERVDEVVLATTREADDDVLEGLAGELGVRCYRGSSNDVLSRFVGAVEGTCADAVVRLTGDDPLLDPAVIDQVVAHFVEGGCDYASNIVERSWPRGLDTEVLSIDALRRSDREGRRPEDREHVTFYVRTHPDIFQLRNVEAPDDERWPDLRLCVDTAEDYEMIRKVFEALYRLGEPLSVGQVVDWLRRHPEVARINAAIQQKATLGKVY